MHLRFKPVHFSIPTRLFTQCSHSVTCHVSCVTCYLSPVTCKMSPSMSPSPSLRPSHSPSPSTSPSMSPSTSPSPCIFFSADMIRVGKKVNDYAPVCDRHTGQRRKMCVLCDQGKLMVMTHDESDMVVVFPQGLRRGCGTVHGLCQKSGPWRAIFHRHLVSTER